jgi:hypothetical protein
MTRIGSGSDRRRRLVAEAIGERVGEQRVLGL